MFLTLCVCLQFEMSEDLKLQDGLVKACAQGEVKDIEEWLSKGANINARASDGSTALYWAVYCLKQANAEYLLSRKADPNGTDENGTFPLLLAAYATNRALCELLLKAGADKNMKKSGVRASEAASKDKELAAFIKSWPGAGGATAAKVNAECCANKRCPTLALLYCRPPLLLLQARRSPSSRCVCACFKLCYIRFCN